MVEFRRISEIEQGCFGAILAHISHPNKLPVERLSEKSKCADHGGDRGGS